MWCQSGEISSNLVTLVGPEKLEKQVGHDLMDGCVRGGDVVVVVVVVAATAHVALLNFRMAH